jgi:hypothetical protein
VPRHRATKAETMERVEQVLEVILHGGRLRNLRDFANQKGWNVSDSQLKKYRTRALELCRQQQEHDRDRTLAVHRMKREVIYARAMEANDLQTACRVLADDAALMKLYDEPSRPAADPLPVADLEAAIGRQIAAAEASELPQAEKGRLIATLADAMIRMKNAGDQEARIAALESVLIRRKDNER